MRWFACFVRPKLEDGISKDSATSQDVKSAALPISKPDLKQDSAYLAKERSEIFGAYDKECNIDYGNKISSEYSICQSIEGQAAPLKLFGPPKPICNAARLANLKELDLMNKPPKNPQIQHIMQLMCTVFNTESALVALVGDDSIYVCDAINFKKGDFAWRTSFCAHTLTPANHQVMVIENAKEDVRFQHLPLVKENKVGFYAGTPIVSSRGHRLGTVCFATSSPRKFDAEGCNMLMNMGELVTRELERDWANKLAEKRTGPKEQDASQLLRAIDCFNDAVLFVDVSVPQWKIMHLNAAAETKFKLFNVAINLEEAREYTIWSFFQLNSQAGEAAPWEAYAKDIEAGRKFEVVSARFSSKHSNSSVPSPVFSLTFRCAANDVLDSNVPAVGAPGYMPTTKSNRNFYFVTLSQVHHSGSRSSTSSMRSAVTGDWASEDVPFENVELGPLLGKGGYGQVYRCRRGEDVLAVKVISDSTSINFLDGVPLEAAITRDAQHPNVLRTMDYAFTNPRRADNVSVSSEEGHVDDSAHIKRTCPNISDKVWLLMELCDCGCLQEASDKGFFRNNGELNMAATLSVAADVASGMAFLHDQGVAHGDLTGGNVLLMSNPSSPAKVTAKVADFGLARVLDVASKIETRTYGTVTHMPPELLVQGIFSQAADSFALGVLLWEMYHGVRAWSSMNHAQIITAVAVNKRSLNFVPEAPQGYASLATALMHQDPNCRPSMKQALATLCQLQASLAS